MSVRHDVAPRELRNGWIQVAFLAIAAIFVLWLRSGDPSARLKAALSRPKSATIVAPAAPLAVPSCSAQQLALSLFFTGCADSLGHDTDLCDASKPGFFQGLAYLRDRSHAYLLYVEVDRGYHGPDTYALAPWPRSGLGAGDGVPKLALLEAGSWAPGRPTGGWLGADPGRGAGPGGAGRVYDGAEASGAGPKT